MNDDSQHPGARWLEVVRRESLDSFALAFVSSPTLEALVLQAPLQGVRAVRGYFEATRAMFDRIRFCNETSSASRVCLEWVGSFQGNEISGATLLSYQRGLIERVRLYYYPQRQLMPFTTELTRRLDASAPDSTQPEGVQS